MDVLGRKGGEAVSQRWGRGARQRQRITSSPPRSRVPVRGVSTSAGERAASRRRMNRRHHVPTPPTRLSLLLHTMITTIRLPSCDCSFTTTRARCCAATTCHRRSQQRASILTTIVLSVQPAWLHPGEITHDVAFSGALPQQAPPARLARHDRHHAQGLRAGTTPRYPTSTAAFAAARTLRLTWS